VNDRCRAFGRHDRGAGSIHAAWLPDGTEQHMSRTAAIELTAPDISCHDDRGCHADGRIDAESAERQQDISRWRDQAACIKVSWSDHWSRS
jgi:hypothetical protein